MSQFNPERETFHPIIARLKQECIIGDRVTLVPFNGSEGRQYQNWFADPDVIKHLDPDTPSIDDKKVSAWEWVGHMRNSLNNVIYRIEIEGKFIGHISMNNIDLYSMSFSTGCVIGDTSYRRQGISVDALRLLLIKTHALGFRKVMASTNSTNIAGKKGLKRLLGPETQVGDELYFERRLG